MVIICRVTKLPRGYQLPELPAAFLLPAGAPRFGMVLGGLSEFRMTTLFEGVPADTVFARRRWCVLNGVEGLSERWSASAQDHHEAKGMQVPSQIMGGGATHDYH
jgi:hypothetical protein